MDTSMEYGVYILALIILMVDLKETIITFGLIHHGEIKPLQRIENPMFQSQSITCSVGPVTTSCMKDTALAKSTHTLIFMRQVTSWD